VVGHYYTQHLAGKFCCERRAHAPCPEGGFRSREPATCPLQVDLRQHLPFRGDVMVCLGLLMLSTGSLPPLVQV